MLETSGFPANSVAKILVLLLGVGLAASAFAVIDYRILKMFGSITNDGLSPEAPLIEGIDGAVYGTTTQGGSNNVGTVFKLNKDGTGYRVLHSFGPSVGDGYSPRVGLVAGNDGGLYGTTYLGGRNASGTIFKLNHDGSGYSILYNFTTLNPSPGALMLGSDGTLYGATGSASGGGNIGTLLLKLNKDGSGYSTLYTFTDQIGPGVSTLLEGSDGVLYGTTGFGGSLGYGTVFTLNKDGSGYTVLYSFIGPSSGGDGHGPTGLVEGSDGALYGTTGGGGTGAYGTVFRLNKDGSGYRVLYNFPPLNLNGDGATPNGGLVEWRDGAIYGTTFWGGIWELQGGTIFKLNKDGTGFEVLHSFAGGFDGGRPHAGLLAGSDGALYGPTVGIGVQGQGTVFRLEVVVPLNIHNVAVPEGDSGTTNAVFTVHLFTNHAEIVSVDFATADGSATAGSDYVATNGTLIFAPGETNKTISVPVIGDLLPETDETFFLTLSNPTNIELVIHQAQGTILDDDTPPSITSQPQSQSVPLGSNVTFSVTAGGGRPLLYQWLTNGVDVAGATNATLTRTNVQLAEDGTSYTVLASGKPPSVLSEAAILTVFSKPIITSQPTPTNQTVLAGSTVSMSVSAVGTLPLSYSWRLNGTKVTNITLNSFTCTYTIQNVQTNQAGSYKVGITNVVGSASALTAAAVLNVLADSDHDGMPDVWESLYGLNPNNPNDAAQDADLDGMTNWQEYIAGTDPRDPQSYLKIDSIEAGGSGGALLRFVAVSNRTYTVQSRAAVDHGEWSRVADVAAAPSNRLINLPDPLSAPSLSQRFYRLVTPGVP